MQNFICHTVQYSNPILIKAKNELEARKIMLNRKKISIEHTEITIRNKNQHWFKSWLEDNF